MPAPIETLRDLRKKLKRAEKSRTTWKNKQQKKQYEIKKLKSHLNSMRTNRDEFKLRCMHLEGTVDELQQEATKLKVEANRQKKEPVIIDPDRSFLKKNPSTQQIDYAEKVKGYTYPIWIIHLAILLVTQGGLKFRSAQMAINICSLFMSEIKQVPFFTTIRIWVLKFGLHKLNAVKQQAHNWAVVIDHSIQMGRLKVLVALGLQLEKLPEKRALTLEDVQPLLVLPMKTSTGKMIDDRLKELKNDLGSIRLIVADEGSDIKAGVNFYIKEHPETDYITDIVHKLAHFLNRELKEDSEWKKLTKKASETRVKLLQTDFSHLLPPQRRDKSRFLDLEETIKWAYRIIIAFEWGKFTDSDHEKIFKYFWWVYEMKEDIDRFHQLWQVVAVTRNLVRVQGYQTNTDKFLKNELSSLPLGFCATQFAEKIMNFISDQSSKVALGERLLGSSEVIESLFGSLKNHLGYQTRSGFTTSVLLIPALVGEIKKARIIEAMSEVHIKDVNEWAEENLGDTIQKKRREFFKQTQPELEKNFAGNNGTENGKFITGELEVNVV